MVFNEKIVLRDKSALADRLGIVAKINKNTFLIDWQIRRISK